MMLKSTLSLCILSLFCVSVLAQVGGPGPGNIPSEFTDSSEAVSTSSTTTNSADRTTKDNTATGTAGNNNSQNNAASANTASSANNPAIQSSPTTADTLPEVTSGLGGEGGTGTLDASGTVMTSSSTSNRQTVLPTPTAEAASGHVGANDGGLTTAVKAGLGVGLGVGIPLIAGALALFFILRRRRANNRFSSGGVSTQHLREQPAMASAAPALAGMSEMGHVDSKHSLHRTPSQHSLASVPEPPLQPMMIPPPQQPLSRGPSQHSAGPSLSERESLMPTIHLPPYDEAPSPLHEHPHDEPPSPVSPISPADSRPPSPLHDHER